MIAINMNSQIPIYLQLKNQIIEAIARKDVNLGESMPTVRQLAQDLGINPMTVNKAYGELKQEGYLDMNLRKGAMVKSEIQEEPDFLINTQPDLKLIIAKSILKGISKEEFIREIEAIYQEFHQANLQS